jgi:AcrR family transcriptional regulator
MCTVAARLGPMPGTELLRPTREHAIEFAIRMFARGERVDMQTLAAELGVGRTTLYRWVGDREQLLGEVLAIMTRRTWDLVASEPRPEGIDGALSVIRRFMETTAAFPPLRRFAQREPGPALRVLMSVDGAVAQALRDGTTRACAENLARPAHPDPELVEVLVQIGTAGQWAPIVAGEEPPIERQIDLMRTVLETGDRRG